VEPGVKGVFLSFPREITQLSKFVVLHDDVEGLGMRSVRDKDTAVLLCSEKLIFDPETGVLSLTDLSVIVEDRGLVASDSRPMNETQAALLNDSSGRLAISNELDDKETNFIRQFREVKRQNFLLVFKCIDIHRL